MDDLFESLKAALPERYRLEREIGAGGMAMVYRAVDVPHDRPVALKVLRPELAAVVGVQRFLTEIRVTANLQHPHILALHDSGEAGGFLYYVMPYVEGESLRDRLDQQTQLSVEEALRITRQVADALSHAHALGVIHRDIKPENILLSGGHALVADFGIARAVTEAGGRRLTETGISLGTPQYMSPEQAAGDQGVDARTDQYSLACVVFEMLAGEPPFTGPTAQAIFAKVLTRPAPAVRAARETVHPGTDAAIRKALSRLPADRFASVGAFTDALRTTDTLTTGMPPYVDSPSGPRRTWRRILPWGVAGTLAVALTALLFRPPGDAATGGAVRMVLDPRPAEAVSMGGGLVTTALGAEVDALAISPDGRRIAFIGRDPGETTTHIYLRDLGQYEARALPETESATSPFFSPDGQWVGFYNWSDRRLKRISVAGGAPQVICQCEPILSATWGPDGRIVMDSDGLLGLRVVAASGGEAVLLGDAATLQKDEFGLAHPRFLPDGRHVLATAWGNGGATRRIVAVSMDNGERKTLLEEGWAPQYVRGGYVVYQRPDQLWAAPFDTRHLTLRGTPVPVLDSVYSITFIMPYAVSTGGTLVYAPGPAPAAHTSLYLVGQSGEMEEVHVEAPGWSEVGPQLSPDGNRIVFTGTDPAGLSGGQASARIWLLDRARGSIRALTDEGPGDFWPLWAPDGRTVFFASLRGGGVGIHSVPGDGSGPARLVYADSGITQPQSWLPDGKGLIVQRAASPDADYDIWLLPLTGDPAPVPLVEGPANQIHPSLSPDGKWLAYASDLSGRYEIYVQPYPALDEVRQVSHEGGMGPLWRSDSHELYFYRRSHDGGSATTFLRVRVDAEPATPEPIWSHPAIASVGMPYGRGYDVTPDGRQLLVSISATDWSEFLPDLRILFNWFDDLEQRLGN